MIDKVYMNLEKNEAHIIFEDGRVVRLFSDKCIIEFYEWFFSDTYYPLGKHKEHKEMMARCTEDTQIIELHELEDNAA